MFQRVGRPEAVGPGQPHACQRRERGGLRGLVETGVATRSLSAPTHGNRGMGACAVAGCGKWADDPTHAPADE